MMVESQGTHYPRTERLGWIASRDWLVIVGVIVGVSSSHVMCPWSLPDSSVTVSLSGAT